MSKSGPLQKSHAARLAEIFSHVQTKAELEDLITDLFTPAERKDLWERWCIVDLLFKGIAQRDIRDQLGVSISKVTRGSRELQFGTGAFRRLWEKLQKKQ
jgi:TrpR family trp operon transcriptional repressor